MAHQTQVRTAPAPAAEEPTIGALVHRLSEHHGVTARPRPHETDREERR